MPDLTVILIPAGVIVAVLVAVGFFIIRRDRIGSPQSIKNTDNSTILKAASRRLAQNPKDHEALMTLADGYYEQGDFPRSLQHAKNLVDLAATNPEVNEFRATLRYALAALKLKDYGEAYKGLMIARTLNEEDTEVNYNLGYLEFLQKHYEKAIGHFRKVRAVQPEGIHVTRLLGQSLARTGQYQEAAGLLRQVIELEPDDRESLYALAQCHYELGNSENALRIFAHLRPDPRLGPNASIYAGTINMNAGKYDKAIEDFEIGLKHEKTDPEVSLELKYRLAAAYFREQNLGSALRLWNEIASVNPRYKDVKDLITKNQELNANRSLQVYLLGTKNEFLTLCRRIASTYFPRSHAKIVSVSAPSNEYLDILAEVGTQEWDETVLYRFVRSAGAIGELLVRDLYETLKDTRAGRGICLTAGTFSEGATRYVEARLIDLIDKDKLLKLLARAPK